MLYAQLGVIRVIWLIDSSKSLLLRLYSKLLLICTRLLLITLNMGQVSLNSIRSSKTIRFVCLRDLSLKKRRIWFSCQRLVGSSTIILAKS